MGNPYAFVGNNPWTYMDPYGEAPSFALPAEVGEAILQRAQEESEILESGRAGPGLEFRDSIANSVSNIVTFGFVGESNLEQAARFDQGGYLYETTVTFEIVGVIGGIPKAIVSFGPNVLRWGKKGIGYFARKKADDLAVDALSKARPNVVALRARILELGTDPARGLIRAEGVGGIRIEQALGRTIVRSTDEAADFVDEILGPISLKGQIPSTGSFEGLARAAVKDARSNTYTKALFIDLRGLSAADKEAVRKIVAEGTQGVSKIIQFLE